MKRTLLLSSVLALLLGACNATYTVTRTRAQLQQAVAQRFPVSHEQFLIKVTLSNPTVLLRTADRRIGVELDANIAPPLGGSVHGRMALLGEPWYDRASKSFFLRNPVVDHIDVPGFQLANDERVRSALSAVAARALDGTPVYTLEGDRSADERKAELWLKEVYVKDDKLYFVLAP